MKHLKIILLLFVFITFPALILAQAPPPPPDKPAQNPVDGGKRPHSDPLGQSAGDGSTDQKRLRDLKINHRRNDSHRNQNQNIR